MQNPSAPGSELTCRPAIQKPQSFLLFQFISSSRDERTLFFSPDGWKLPSNLAAYVLLKKLSCFFFPGWLLHPLLTGLMVLRVMELYCSYYVPFFFLNCILTHCLSIHGSLKKLCPSASNIQVTEWLPWKDTENKARCLWDSSVHFESFHFAVL